MNEFVFTKDNILCKVCNKFSDGMILCISLDTNNQLIVMHNLEARKAIFVDPEESDTYKLCGKIITNDNENAIIAGVRYYKNDNGYYLVKSDWYTAKELRDQNWYIDGHPFGIPLISNDDNNELLTVYDK